MSVTLTSFYYSRQSRLLSELLLLLLFLTNLLTIFSLNIH